MTFAWPSLLPRNCVDPANKYHGHLLLAHIIAKFAIHKRIVLQVKLFFFSPQNIVKNTITMDYNNNINILFNEVKIFKVHQKLSSIRLFFKIVSCLLIFLKFFS